MLYADTKARLDLFCSGLMEKDDMKNLGFQGNEGPAPAQAQVANTESPAPSQRSSNQSKGRLV